MYIILSQRIDYESKYNVVPFELYHYPKKYRNQIKEGNIFIYYQGNSRKKENRYYYGCGKMAKITTDEDEHYFATIEKGIRFPKKGPIYHEHEEFYESIGYEEVLKKDSLLGSGR